MTRSNHFLIAIGLLAMCAEAHAMTLKGMTSVAPNGTTTVVSVIGKESVQAAIFTHEKQIGSASDPVPLVIDSSCTYSRYPCSIVDRISITVNGHSLFISRSLFCDLADVNRAKIIRRKGGYVLLLEAGDASGAYEAKIDFDTARVIRRLLIDGETNKPLEATTYYRVTM
ncbi:MAG TPA: hypothetical protein VN693_02330 [Rhodanobacteraceae bacterium]|nr:hypothetical protein [Rhodanobacteraceae bacterium]